MEKLNFIYNRKSIRKFKDEKVRHEDLIEIIKAGMQAPSAHNVQNWHYVVVESKNIIEKIAKIITEKHSKIIDVINDEEKTKRFNKMIKYYTFFKDAPALILVFGSSYEPTGIDLLNKIDDNESQNFIDVQPGIQNIGANSKYWCNSRKYIACNFSTWLWGLLDDRTTFC